MNLFHTIVLIVLASVVLLLGSFIAKVLNAKRYKIYWTLLAWVLAVVAIIVANVLQLDGLYALIAGLVVLVVSWSYISGMTFSSALTTTLASISVLVLAFAGSIYALHVSGMQSDKLAATLLKYVPESQFYDVMVFQESTEKEQVELFEAEDLHEYSDSDLLPGRAANQFTLKSKAYREVDPRKASAMRGAMIRLLKTDGKILKGNIVGVKGGALIVGKYVHKKGLIQAPVPFYLIEKLEVIGR